MEPGGLDRGAPDRSRPPRKLALEVRRIIAFDSAHDGLDIVASRYASRVEQCADRTLGKGPGAPPETAGATLDSWLRVRR